MKITTFKGDKGMTDVYGGRVDKCCDIVELLGTLDEAASVIALSAAFIGDEDICRELLLVVNVITRIAAKVYKKEDAVVDEEIRFLDEKTAYYEDRIKNLKLFEYPHTKEAAILDYARCVVRRAERCAVRCKRDIRYLNRLSDYLFVLSRYKEYGE